MARFPFSHLNLPAARFPPVSEALENERMSARVRSHAEQVARQFRLEQNEQLALEAQLEAVLTELLPAQFLALLKAAYRVGEVFQFPFTVGTTALMLRPREHRYYCAVQNQSANQIVLSIGRPPANINDGIIVGANLGFIEPLVVPQQELWVLASGAGSAGCILISTSLEAAEAP
jgi:hypothetical protein